MKKVILSLIFILSIQTLFSQEKKEVKVVDEMPLFQGCEKKRKKVKREECTNIELFKYIQKNYRPPKEHIGKNQKGKIVIQFTVDSLGFVIDPTILEGFGGPYNKEFNQKAMDVVNSIPRFTPGKSDGEAVKVQYTIPIRYSERY